MTRAYRSIVFLVLLDQSLKLNRVAVEQETRLSRKIDSRREKDEGPGHHSGIQRVFYTQHVLRRCGKSSSGVMAHAQKQSNSPMTCFKCAESARSTRLRSPTQPDGALDVPTMTRMRAEAQLGNTGGVSVCACANGVLQCEEQGVVLA